MLLLLLSLAAPAPTASPEPGVYYKSPQDVFDASQKAAEKKDFSAAIDCIAPEARREMAGMMAAMALMLKKLPVEIEQLKEMRKALGEVMDRHGLTDKATEGIGGAAGPDGGFKLLGDARAREALGKLVKKPEPFLLDMLKAQDKASESLKGLLPAGKPVQKLSDVKITGDKATGVIKVTHGLGGEASQKVSFVKRSNGWRMIPSYDALAGVAGPADKGGK